MTKLSFRIVGHRLFMDFDHLLDANSTSQLHLTFLLFVCFTAAVDGNWGAWSTSGQCSATCGQGHMIKVCVYVCACVCICVCVCLCVYVCMYYVCMHVCIKLLPLLILRYLTNWSTVYIIRFWESCKPFGEFCNLSF